MGASRVSSTTSAQEKTRLLVASQWQLVRWRFVRHKLAIAGMVVLGVFYGAALFAEFVAPYDPHAHDIDLSHVAPQRIHFRDAAGRFHPQPFVYRLVHERDPRTLRRVYAEDTSTAYPIRLFVKGDPYRLWGLVPSDRHLFGAVGGRVLLLGTDQFGQDMLSRIIHASRISLSIGLVGVAVSFVLGIVIGAVSGYFGGTVDLVIQRLIEFIRSIPTLPLWMGLSAALPPYWSVTKVYFGIVIILSLVAWTGLARVVRGKFMAVREEDFVMAARLQGAGEARIIFMHLLPSFYSHIIAALTLSIPGMILGETALSFLGLGLQSPAISWGVLLKESQAISVLADAPWLLIPVIFVIMAILAFNFVGDGLRDAADPYASV